MANRAASGTGRTRHAGFVAATLLGIGAGAAGAALVAEIEPNDSLATATALGNFDQGSGAISPAGDRDFWVTSGQQAEHQIFAMVATAQSTASKDALLVAYDDGGAEIAVDDNDGPGAAPALAGETVPLAGDVSFEIYEQNDDGEISAYELYQLIADPALTIAEVEPNDSSAEATPVERQSVAAGAITTGQSDYYAIPLESGESLAVILDRDPDRNSLSVSTLIDVLDTDGSTVLASGDLISGNAHAAGPVAAPDAGTYFVRVAHGGGGPDDDYEVAFVTTVPEPIAAGAALAAFGALAALSRGRARSRA